jgi:hypothetical protein
MKLLFHNLETQDHHILKVDSLKRATEILEELNKLRANWFVTHVVSGYAKFTIGYHYKQYFHIV